MGVRKQDIESPFQARLVLVYEEKRSTSFCHFAQYLASYSPITISVSLNCLVTNIMRSSLLLLATICAHPLLSRASALPRGTPSGALLVFNGATPEQSFNMIAPLNEPFTIGTGSS